jgi:hypothetical protein
VREETEREGEILPVSKNISRWNKEFRGSLEEQQQQEGDLEGSRSPSRRKNKTRGDLEEVGINRHMYFTKEVRQEIEYSDSLLLLDSQEAVRFSPLNRL